jgi:hypothetical protein
MEKVKLFICYARGDSDELQEIRKWLHPRMISEIEVWYDGDIEVGTDWDLSIKQNLSSSDIVLLLVSNNFLISDYINNIELKKALEGHRNNSKKVIPLFIKDCLRDNDPDIKSLQGFPREGRFIFKEGEPDDRVLVEVQTAIRDLARKLLTNWKLSEAAAKNDETGRMAKAIQSHESTPFIYLAKTGNANARRNQGFLNYAGGRISNEAWPYKIIPDKDSLSVSEEILESQLKNSKLSVHIIGQKEDLMEGWGKIQFNKAKNHRLSNRFFKQIMWILDEKVLDQFDNSFSTELKQLPSVTGPDIDRLFELIDDTLIQIEKDLSKNKLDFSPSKVVMLYQDVDHTNQSRKRIKQEIEKNNISLFMNPLESTKEIDEELLAGCKGALIFWGESDIKWYSYRQYLLQKLKDIGIRVVCISDPDKSTKPEEIAKNILDVIDADRNDELYEKFIHRITG